MVQDTHSCSQHCLVLEQVGLERAVNMKWWTSSCTNLNSSTACFRIVDEELKALIPARLARLVLHWALLCVVTDGDACKHIAQWVWLVAELSANSQNSCKKKQILAECFTAISTNRREFRYLSTLTKYGIKAVLHLFRLSFCFTCHVSVMKQNTHTHTSV